MDDTLDHHLQNKYDLISQHNHMRRAVVQCHNHSSHIICSHSGYLAEKPQTSSKPLQTLLPIHCPSLAPGGVHFDRILRGTLVVDPYVMKAAQSIIEDETGAAASISFYNFAPDGLDHNQLQRVASSLLSRGTKIAIVEPYYKVGADGSLIIRVDNFAQDVEFFEYLGPRVSRGWRDEGKALFQKNHIEESIFSYKRSIDTHFQSKLAATLLSNIATALLVKEDFVSGLIFSVASFVVNGSMFRPYYTAGFILNKLKRFDLVFNCLEQCRKQKAPTNLCRQLAAQLWNRPQVHVPASKWNADVLSIVASENVLQLLQVKPDTAINSFELKDRGNTMFKNKDYNGSIQNYCTALRGIPEVATLLSNRAICNYHLGNHAEAALHASAAILLTPSLAKAHYCKVKSLLHLNHEIEARECWTAALALVGDNDNLNRLFERTGISVEQPRTEVSGCPDVQEGFSERDHSELFNKGSAPASVVARVNRMIELVNITDRTAGNIRGNSLLHLDDRVLPFHLEFSHEGKWPLCCDLQSSMELLTSAYEHARAPDPFQIKEVMNTEPDIEVVYKRLHTCSPNVLQWWLHAPLRSFSPKVRRPYYSNIVHSFTNSPCRENAMMLGTVHISVGFTDLSELLFSRFIPSEDHSGPLRWIGYEQSAYSVAKTMVIAEMLRQQDETNQILQVWYSSSWSKETLCSFRKAVKNLVDFSKKGDGMQHPNQVVRLWHYWQKFDVSLRTARSEWISRHSYNTHVEIANFRRKMDRIALCRYLVSGEVLEGAHGSIVMFGLPTQTNAEGCVVSLNEWFLHCLNLHSILEECDSETNVIEAAIKILQRRILELKERLCKGTVEIEVRYESVTPHDQQNQFEIRNLSPHSMSWNNICDYCSNEEFHKMARACSGEDTVHYLYSMNWSTEIKGAHLMDYKSDQHREKLETFNVSIASLYRMNGMVQYLHTPPIIHPYNVASHCLGKLVHQVWTNIFFMAADLDQKDKAVRVLEPVIFDVLGRGQTTIHMVYTYNPEINWSFLPGTRNLPSSCEN